MWLVGWLVGWVLFLIAVLLFCTPLRFDGGWDWIGKYKVVSNPHGVKGVGFCFCRDVWWDEKRGIGKGNEGWFIGRFITRLGQRFPIGHTLHLCSLSSKFPHSPSHLFKWDLACD